MKKICPTCNQEFEVPQWRAEAKFCSRACIRLTEETKKHLSNIRKGIPKTEEWKRNMSISKMAEKNPFWKGDKAGLDAIHVWVTKRFPKPELCQGCGEEPPIDLANISQEYRRLISDWEWLCRRCHMTKDGRLERLRNHFKKS